MSVSNQRSRFQWCQSLRWFVLALAILAAPGLAHAGGAVKVSAEDGSQTLWVIGADGDIYHYCQQCISPTWVKENFPYQPVIDMAVAGSYVYALAWNMGNGYLLFRRPTSGGGWDWETFYNTTNGVKIYGTLVTAHYDDVVIVQPSGLAYRWVPSGSTGYWSNLQNIAAYDITTTTYPYGGYPLEGNVYFVSSGGTGYRWNGNGTGFTVYPRPTNPTAVLKSLVAPNADATTVHALDTLGYLRVWVPTYSRWDVWTTASRIRDFVVEQWSNVPTVISDSYTCSGGGYAVARYVPTSSGYVRTPVGPNNGCVY